MVSIQRPAIISILFTLFVRIHADCTNSPLVPSRVSCTNVNSFASVTQLMSHNTDITQLNLNRNKLMAIRRNDFNSLQTLVELNLAFNKIAVIESNAFGAVHNLYKINLHSNRLRMMPYFGELTQLKWLDVSKNKIAEVPGDAFVSMPNLEFLSLAQNRITKLDDKVLAPLTSLHRLHIQNNAIGEISPVVMEQVLNLDDFHFRRNHLTFLPISSTTHIKWRKVSIEGNPWQCPCLLELFDILSQHHVEFIEEGNSFYKGLNPICTTTVADHCRRDSALVAPENLINKYKAKLSFSPSDFE